MGLGSEQFAAMTPAEFAAAVKAWGEQVERQRREDWERARQICFCAVAPYSNKAKRPQDIMRFSWDGEAEQPKAAEASTRERFEAAKKLFNLQ